MARKRGTFRIFYNGLDPSGTGNPGTAWVTGRGFGAFQRPVNTQQQLLSYIMSLNPIAYWPLNDPAGSLVAKDITGNGFNGTVSGAVTFGTAGLTTFGETSANFTGGQINTNFNIPNAPFTVLNIRKQNAAVVGVQGFAWEWFDGSNGIRMYIQSAGNNGVVNNFRLNGTGSYGGQVSGTNDTNINVDALVYDGSKALNYCNGSSGQPGIAVAFGQPSVNFSIGGPGVVQTYNGSAAHIAILPYAMTAAQITSLQNFITAGPVSNFGGLADAAVGPMGALSVGGPARGSKGYGVVAAGAIAVNGDYNYLPVAGQTMPAGSTAFKINPTAPLSINSATISGNPLIVTPEDPTGYLESYPFPGYRVGYIMKY